MPKRKSPRRGSMQYWPRVRSKRSYARLRNHNTALAKGTKACGFAGYKVGMTQVTIVDNKKTSLTKGESVIIPVTVLECPPLKVYGVRFYTDDHVEGLKVASEYVTKTNDKNLKRKVRVAKKDIPIKEVPNYNEIRLLVYTQPSLTSIGKKKPEIFEIAISGSKEEQLSFAKENYGKEIKVTDVIEPGISVDTYAVTTGKGTQGPVKRFGVDIRRHKSEKTKRGPGSIAGGWKAQGHMMYRVAFAGQMGYHQRAEYNKWVVKIGDDPKEINPKGGFVRYGNVKNTFMLLKGSIPGPSKRLIRFSSTIRPQKNQPTEAPIIKHISLESKQ